MFMDVDMNCLYHANHKYLLILMYIVIDVAFFALIYLLYNIVIPKLFTVFIT